MKNYNLMKWGYGLVAVLVVGLSGCTLDGVSQQERDYSSQEYNVPANQDTANATTQKQASASKEPVQKSTPGPKRAAAPQLPVIQ